MEFSLPSQKKIPDIGTCNIFISTIDDYLNHYYYLIDLKSGKIRHWYFDTKLLLSYMENIMKPYWRQAIEKFSTKESFLSALTEPHAACYENGRICITPLIGNFILVIDLNTNDYEILTDNPLYIFCSTKNIVNNSLYFSRWKFTDALLRERPEQTLDLEIGRYSFVRHKFEILKTIDGPDNIHDTIVTPNEDKILVLEMPRFPNYSDNVEEIIKNGIHGKFIVYDIQKDVCQTEMIEGGPGHIVLDGNDSSTVYLSCHNLLHSGCYGPGRFYKYNIEDQLRCTGKYENEVLFRIPSHSFYCFKNENLICTTAFPNQLFLIYADKMTLKKRICVGKTDCMPSFQNGPYTYPKHDRTPYGAFPIDNTPYIVLANLWTVSILNVETEKIIYSSSFNINNNPISFTGHSLCIREAVN